MPQFSWQPIYEKIARKLLEFEHRRPELLAILESIAALGLPILNPRANQPSLQEIDPLTFLAAFNRQLADGNRIKIIREIQQRLGLAPELPDDFDGIPVVNNMKSMFFVRCRQRRPTSTTSGLSCAQPWGLLQLPWIQLLSIGRSNTSDSLG